MGSGFSSEEGLRITADISTNGELDVDNAIKTVGGGIGWRGKVGVCCDVGGGVTSDNMTLAPNNIESEKSLREISKPKFASVGNIRTLTTAGPNHSYKRISDLSILSHATPDDSQFDRSSLERKGFFSVINNPRREPSPFFIFFTPLCKRSVA